MRAAICVRLSHALLAVKPSVGSSDGNIVVAVGGDLDIYWTEYDITYSVGGVQAAIHNTVDHAAFTAQGFTDGVLNMAADVNGSLQAEAERRILAENSVLSVISSMTIRSSLYLGASDQNQASARTSIVSNVLGSITSEKLQASTAEGTLYNSIYTDTVNLNSTIDQEASTRQIAVGQVATAAYATTSLISSASATITSALASVVAASNLLDAAFVATNNTVLYSQYALGNVSNAVSLATVASSTAVSYRATTSASVPYAQLATTNTSNSFNAVTQIIRGLTTSYSQAAFVYSYAATGLSQASNAISQAVFDNTSAVLAQNLTTSASNQVIASTSTATVVSGQVVSSYSVANSAYNAANVALALVCCAVT